MKRYEIYSKNNLDRCITNVSFNEWCSYNTPMEKALAKFSIKLNVPNYTLFDDFIIKEII
jgi:hypothetical protein